MTKNKCAKVRRSIPQTSNIQISVVNSPNSVSQPFWAYICNESAQQRLRLLMVFDCIQPSTLTQNNIYRYYNAIVGPMMTVLSQQCVAVLDYIATFTFDISFLTFFLILELYSNIFKAPLSGLSQKTKIDRPEDLRAGCLSICP